MMLVCLPHCNQQVQTEKQKFWKSQAASVEKKPVQKRHSFLASMKLCLCALHAVSSLFNVLNYIQARIFHSDTADAEK